MAARRQERDRPAGSFRPDGRRKPPVRVMRAGRLRTCRKSRRT
ncbi:hypothetical protein C7S15_6152 [Burkholderia cepacia]|nr:hypothetical protein [Burkholderia cepacia]